MFTKDASPNYGVSLGWSSHVFAFEFPMCSPDGGEQPSCVVLVNAGIKSVWPQPDRSQWGCQRQYLPLLGSLHRLQSEAKHIVCHALYIALYKTTACIDYISAEEVKSKYYVVHLMYDVHGFFCKSAITLKASQLTRLTAVSIGRGEDKTYHRTHNVFFITCPVLWNVNCTLTLTATFMYLITVLAGM